MRADEEIPSKVNDYQRQGTRKRMREGKASEETPTAVDGQGSS